MAAAANSVRWKSNSPVDALQPAKNRRLGCWWIRRQKQTRLLPSPIPLFLQKLQLNTEMTAVNRNREKRETLVGELQPAKESCLARSWIGQKRKIRLILSPLPSGLRIIWLKSAGAAANSFREINNKLMYVLWMAKERQIACQKLVSKYKTTPKK